MTNLTELFQTNDTHLLKRELSRLTKEKDYKTINALLRRNPNVSLFDTRSLNEEIPQQEKHFVKRNGVMKNEAKPKTFKERLDESLKNIPSENLRISERAFASRINRDSTHERINKRSVGKSKTKQNLKK